ncbi:aldo/keto reductase [Clostridium chromiireducens]|uniref:L-glyceraldehyde 3-phosphate reductase n=1 Tax=Clostridium chromiireducens TaxID=225345 RepID=A0A1V4INZ5_9CLOT|nr:aldo/keto reductase [Clostridium chromiireducens]OPJ61589.1 L-glyceraldehyde 3-phosphate reductase [Clostridium chromiireducens]
MKYTRLGNTGLEVSRICLGCMSYGNTGTGINERPWTLSEEESRKFIKLALDNGVNYFDLSNNYSDGDTERIVGRAIKDFVRRDDVVIADRVFAPMRPVPNGMGLSRKAIMTEIDDSLMRLGTDYIDIYEIGRFDYNTPLEETLEALNDLVKAGKVRYLGASTMYAWQLMKAIGIQKANGWHRFVVMENYYNLLYREEEREMLPLCESEGIGVTPWSPLARGRLTRPWVDGVQTTERGKTDAHASQLNITTNLDKPIVDRLAEVAERRGVPMAQIALAWLLSKSVITSPIVGATKEQHIKDAVEAVELELSEDEIAALEEFYKPHTSLNNYNFKLQAR